jgi:hypothetical protein
MWSRPLSFAACASIKPVTGSIWVKKVIAATAFRNPAFPVPRELRDQVVIATNANRTPT